MSFCDGCGKKFRPPIVYDENDNFVCFDYLCSSCQQIGRWVDTEEAIRRYDWHRVTTAQESTDLVENLLVNHDNNVYFD